MQYINSNLGIPVLPKFTDMMSANSYANASGDSVSSLESKIASLEKEINSLQVKKQKEEVKLASEQDKKQKGFGKLATARFKQGERDIREANVAINQAQTEIKNLDNKIKLLSIDLGDVQNRLKSAGASLPTPPPTPKPPTPSVPVIDGGTPSAGLVPLPESGNTSQDGSTGTPKKTNWVLIAAVGLAGYLALAYFVNKVIKPQ
jgi:uncharacterized coiled-coil protein SlyX